MRDVFLESGFQVSEQAHGNEVVVDLAVLPGEAGLAKMEARQRQATGAALRHFFKPNAVAVIGASRNPQAIGGRVLRAIRAGGFPGAVFPVNPKAEEIEGLRSYRTVQDLPLTPDLAVIVVRAEGVCAIARECARRGVRALLVLSAGFAEVGPAGRQLQRELVEIVRGHGMSLMGPNCLGFLTTEPGVRLNASFAPQLPPPGGVAMSSDSGALGIALLAAAEPYDLGVSSFVSVGNRADISSNDLLEYWEEEEATRVILLYLESFGNPRRFARIARRVSRRKPIIAVKSGRSVAGRRAAGSHTAALAASDVAVEALFRQTGVIRAETTQEMFELAAALTHQPVPRGRRVAIITNGGGPAILCADACEAAGLRLPPLSETTRTLLASFLPAAASLGNPVDMIASAGPQEFRKAVAAVLNSGEVDGLIVIYVAITESHDAAIRQAIGDGVKEARQTTGREIPVLVCLMPDQNIHHLCADAQERIPCYPFPEAAARALGKAAACGEWLGRPLGMFSRFDDADVLGARAICRRALLEQGEGWLSAEQARGVLAAMRLPLPPGGIARTADDAVSWSEKLGFPVAVKLASRHIVHKTEVGGVILNLASGDAVRQAFQQVQDRLASFGKLEQMEGVLVQPMISGGAEVMIGMTHDPLFGPLVAFGLGGIHVEILGDVVFRVTPLSDRDAAAMVTSIRGFRLLEGYRGHAPADVAALTQSLLRISQLVEEVPEICELDLNPIIALTPGEGCMIIDARIRVAQPA